MKSFITYIAKVIYDNDAGDEINADFESNSIPNLFDQIEIAFQNIGKIKNRKAISRMIDSLNVFEAVEISVPAKDKTYNIRFSKI